MNKIHILLPVYNRCQITQNFINCLKQQTYSNYHLILIDDGSTDGTAEMVKKNIPDVSIIYGKGNWWWGGSLQQGFKFIRAQSLPKDDIILIINDDAEIENDFLEKGCSLLMKHTKTLIQAEYYGKESRKFIGSGLNIDWAKLTFRPAPDLNEINCLSSRGLIMRVADFLEIGGFRPVILPHYASDTEFTIRASRKGFRLLTNPEFKLFGFENETGLKNEQINNMPFRLFIKNYFSKRFMNNPLIMLGLIVTACPWKWKIPGILRVFKRSSVFVIEYLRKGRK